MKTLLTVAFSAVVSVSAFAQDIYKVDTAATNIVWVGKKVTGEHTGTVKAKSGSFTVKDGMITAGEVVIDMTSITVTDLTDKEYNAKFIGHITSPDFFDTTKHPESKFVVKSVKKTSKGQEISGDFTMIGKTKPLKFIATDVKADGKELTASAALVIDRTKWDLKYGSGSFFKGLGDKAINNEFTLNVTLKATK
jgi:polyisoprenoid-binding protein YceI